MGKARGLHPRRGRGPSPWPCLFVLLCAAAPQTETIVLLRHGEKPPGGLGQLSCQGLNRALALPARLIARFGRPDALFAPDPAARKSDSGQEYDYVRPLATIEPLAIAAGRPVQTEIGYADIDHLQQALQTPKLHNAVVMVAWEHHALVDLARTLMQAHAPAGGPAATLIPDWPASDFDRLYVVRLDWSGDHAEAHFTQTTEGLPTPPTSCPTPP